MGQGVYRIMVEIPAEGLSMSGIGDEFHRPAVGERLWVQMEGNYDGGVHAQVVEVEPPSQGQTYLRWFTEWPSTHVNAGKRVEVVPATWDGLMAILATYYPADVFTGESSDLGAKLVAAIREVRR